MTAPIATLGANHGYRLDGDIVHLNAEIACDASRLHGQSWALQLWANDLMPIAELPLGLLYPDTDGQVRVAGSTQLTPPAGSTAYRISLHLHCDGQSVDQAAYPSAECFLQPRLSGSVEVDFGNEGATIAVETIENPRPVDNLSGTLALEIWSLDAPCHGGNWQGTPVASLILGSLAGQQAWRDNRFPVHAATVPDTGHLTLMLREWTAAGYVTRDFRDLPRPPVAAAKPAKKKTAARTSAPVAVNSASVEEIAAVKGISSAVAKAIVAARPYATLDDLIRARGMGRKLLDKVRAGLTL